MSKGRAGITGAVWSPVPFEIYEDEWPVIIGYLEEARGEGLSEGLKAEVRERVNKAIADYQGQRKEGLPPTEAEQRSKIKRIQKKARELRDALEDVDLHTSVLLTRATPEFSRSELLETLEDLVGAVPNDVRRPKGRPDPYLEWLVRKLFHVWLDMTKQVPRITSQHKKNDRKSGPFLDWINYIADPIDGLETVPRGLTEAVIKAETAANTRSVKSPKSPK